MAAPAPVPIVNAGRLLWRARMAARRLATTHALSESDQDELTGAILWIACERARAGYHPGRRALVFYGRQALVSLRRPFRWEFGADDEDLEALGERAESHEEQSLSLHQIQKIWPSMTDLQRTVLSLRLQGHSLVEIGEAVGSNEGAVNALLGVLRERLSGRHADRLAERARVKAERRCSGCGEPVPPGPKWGRPRLYCSEECGKAYRARNTGERHEDADGNR